MLDNLKRMHPSRALAFPVIPSSVCVLLGAPPSSMLHRRFTSTRYNRQPGDFRSNKGTHRFGTQHIYCWSLALLQIYQWAIKDFPFSRRSAALALVSVVVDIISRLKPIVASPLLLSQSPRAEKSLDLRFYLPSCLGKDFPLSADPLFSHLRAHLLSLTLKGQAELWQSLLTADFVATRP